MRLSLIVLLVALLLPSGEVRAQYADAEAGHPLFIQHFTPADYDRHPQNWDFTQDQRGIIYVANRTGLLEFDGATWRSYRIPNQFVRSVATFRNQVCVGGTAEFGCFYPNGNGELHYVSLIPYLVESVAERGDVWTTLPVDNGVVFQSFQRLYRWDGSTLRTWDALNQFHKGFYVNGRYLVRDEGIGLMELVEDELVLVPGGEQLADERIDAMVEVNGGILMVSRSSGLIRYGEDGFEYMPGSASMLGEVSRVYHGTTLSDGTIALATHDSRVLIISQQGQLLAVLAEDVGIEPGTMVVGAFSDRQDGLWLALDNGILRVDLPSPVTVFDARNGLGGQIYSVFRFDGRIWAGTTQGLFVMRENGSSGLYFEHMEGINGQVWGIEGHESSLFIASNDGTLLYDAGYTASRMLDRERSFAIKASFHDNDIVYVGLASGVARVIRQNGTWVFEKLWDSSSASSLRSLIEEDESTIWVGTMSDGVYRLNLQNGRLVQVDQFRSEEGLPSGTTTVSLRGGEIAVVATGGVYRLDPDNPGRFVIAESSQESISEDYFSANDDQGRTWVFDAKGTRIYQQEGGELIEVTPSALRIGTLIGEGGTGMYSEPEGYVWLYSNQGLFRYDPYVEKDYDIPYQALVRQVWVNGDSLIFAGYGSSSYEQPRLRYALNDLRFTVAAPTFNAPANTLYSYRLRGFDDNWTAWGTDTYKEYTNLPNGTYTFQVRAMNVHGVESLVGSFAFRVLPPWYRTFWAYLVYTVGFGLLLWTYGQWRVREHRLEAEAERQVRAQVEAANRRLKEANRTLVKADKLKDDLLANTSHELRTPLTSILGFATILEEELTGAHQEFAVHIGRSGRRLFKSVDSLLDMARLRADRIELDPEDFDLVEVLERIVSEHSYESSRKGLYFTLLPRRMSLPVRTDRHAVERIINNLVDNAVKFTEEGGVTILVDADETDVYVTIKDTGIGIKKEFIPSLFKEFNQASTGYSRSHEGSGLGLSIAYRFIKCLDGTITYKTEEGQGSSFSVRLPRTVDTQVSLAAVSHADELHRVLVVSPEYPARSELTVSLVSTDFEMADSLDQARELLQDWIPHVIIIDTHVQSPAIPELLSIAQVLGIRVIIAVPSMFDTVPIEWRDEFGATIVRGPISSGDFYSVVDSLAQTPIERKSVEMNDT